jgi:probable HAF family extracellular repeat protein
MEDLMKRMVKGFAVIAVVGLFSSVISAAPLYHVTDLGDLPTGYDNSWATDINNHGEVTGTSYVSNGPGFSTRAVFRWTAQTGIQNLGYPPNPYQSPYADGEGINDQGHIVGIAPFHGGEFAFLWTKESGMRKLGALATGNRSIGYAINSHDQVVGWSYLGPGTGTHAFRWSESTGMQDLGALSDGTSHAYGINDAGQVVGEAIADR